MRRRRANPSAITAHFLRTEREREDIVRTVACPICGRSGGRPCVRTGGVAHTARYHVAAELGLVPPIAVPA